MSFLCGSIPVWLASPVPQKVLTRIHVQVDELEHRKEVVEQLGLTWVSGTPEQTRWTRIVE